MELLSLRESGLYDYFGYFMFFLNISVHLFLVKVSIFSLGGNSVVMINCISHTTIYWTAALLERLQNHVIRHHGALREHM